MSKISSLQHRGKPTFATRLSLLLVAMCTAACRPPTLPPPEQLRAGAPPSCDDSDPSKDLPGRAQQAIIDEAAAAVSRLRRQRKFASIGRFLEEARAVAIFPRLIKASLVFGGEGGNGVAVAKQLDGSWSYPAFYSLGAPSVGFQAGVQATTVLLFIMDDLTVERMVHSSLTLGASSSATLGRIGARDLTDMELLSKDVFELAEAGGAFAGFSFHGYVMTARQKHNSAYYGPKATPQAILFERSCVRQEADVLFRALQAEPSGRSD